LRGPWYLRTSPLSELCVYLLLALIYINFYWPSDIAWTLISQDISTVGASDITSIYGANLAWTLIVRISPLLDTRFRCCVDLDYDVSGHLHCQKYDIKSIPDVNFAWHAVDILLTILTDKTGLTSIMISSPYISLSLWTLWDQELKVLHSGSLYCAWLKLSRFKSISRWRLWDQELKVLHSGSSYLYLCMTQTFKIH
jgi:hypothetical protein